MAIARGRLCAFKAWLGRRNLVNSSRQKLFEPRYHEAVVLAFIVAVAITDTQTTAQTLYKKAQAAVVTILTPSSAGTGFFIGDGSLVLTCYHVVKEDPDKITIKGLGKATLLRVDKTADIALLSSAKRGKSRLKISSQQAPSPGAPVFVIGSPLGVLEKSISEGTLSSVRHVGNSAVLQITAPISHGSSGSPVLDRKGGVIGMAASSLSQGQSLNFAISAMNLQRVISAKGSAYLPPKPELVTNETIITLRRASVFVSPDPYSKEAYSCRKGEIFDVATGKRPGWVLVQFADRSIGYLEEKNVQEATESDIINDKPPIYPEAVRKQIHKYFDEIESDNFDYEKREALRNGIVKLGPSILPIVVYELRQCARYSDALPILDLLSGYDVEVEDTLLSLIEDGNRLERTTAFDVLALHGNALHPHVAEEDSWDMVQRASNVLRRERIVKALIDGLDDPDVQVKCLVILGNLGNRRLHDRIRDIVSDLDEVDQNIIGAFANISNSDDDATLLRLMDSLIRQSLADSSTEDTIKDFPVWEAMHYLAIVNNDATRRVLLSYLRHKTPIVRANACLAMIYLPDHKEASRVAALLDDPDPSVRRNAFATSANYKTPGLESRLVNFAKSKDAYDRTAAIQASTDILDGTKLTDFLVAFCSDPSSDVRRSLAYACIRLPEASLKVISSKLASDPDAGIKKTLRETLKARSERDARASRQRSL